MFKLSKEGQMGEESTKSNEFIPILVNVFMVFLPLLLLIIALTTHS